MTPKTILHVIQHVIRNNLKEGRRDPVITIKRRGKTYQAHTAQIHGPSRLVYSPDKPLSCGARVWLECHCDVTLDGAPLP